MRQPSFWGAAGARRRNLPSSWASRYFIRHGEGFGLITIPAILLGGIAAYFAAVYSIRFLQSRLKDGDYTFFVLYRAVLGIVILSYFIIYALMR